jgi:site-specific recombinase XerD
VDTRQTSNTRLRTAIAGFLAGYRKGTRDTYQRGLRFWGNWCQANGLDPLEAQRPHIELYGRWMEEDRGLMPATVLQRLSILKAFYRYCDEEGYVTKDPAARVRLPRVSAESSTKGLTRQQVSQLLAVSAANPAFHAMVCLLALNGLRISEACGANIADLGVGLGHRTLTVTRKGGKKQTVPLIAVTARAVDAAIGDRTSGPILVTAAGTRMTRSNAGKVLERLGKRAGIDVHVHPHQLRHAFCTIALSAGAQLHDVQDSMGHADPRTTRRYDRNRQSLDRNVTGLVGAFVAAG